jgi:DNA polymerase-3 subunit chi
LLRVDFAFNAPDKVTQAARTTGRQVAKGVRLYVFSQDAQRLDDYDQALWMLENVSFIPRERLLNENVLDVSVYLADLTAWSLLKQRLQPQDWLLNLDDECPPETVGIGRILEIVTNDPDDRARARERWRIYQKLGADLRAFQV